MKRRDIDFTAEFSSGPAKTPRPIDVEHDHIDYYQPPRRSQAEYIAEAPVVPQRFKRWTVPELLESDLTLKWHVRGMICDPTYGVDTGELKTLKSYFGQARAIGIAAGVPVLGHFEAQRNRVLYYVAE